MSAAGRCIHAKTLAAKIRDRHGRATARVSSALRHEPFRPTLNAESLLKQLSSASDGVFKGGHATLKVVSDTGVVFRLELKNWDLFPPANPKQLKGALDEMRRDLVLHLQSGNLQNLRWVFPEALRGQSAQIIAELKKATYGEAFAKRVFDSNSTKYADDVVLRAAIKEARDGVNANPVRFHEPITIAACARRPAYAQATVDLALEPHERSLAGHRVRRWVHLHCPFSGKYNLVAVAPEGSIAWRRLRARSLRVVEKSLLSDGSLLITEKSSRHSGLRILDARTGVVRWSKDETPTFWSLRGNDDLCLGHESDLGKGRGRLLVARRPPSLEVVWERTFLNQSGHGRAVARGASDGKVLYILDLSSTAIAALDLRSGQERWRAEGSALPIPPPSDGDWRGTLVAGGLLVYRSSNALAALDASTGKALWNPNVEGDATVHRDVISGLSRREVWTMSTATGHLIKKRDLTGPLSEAHRNNGLTLGSAVSESHIFVGDDVGTLWALDRESLDPVWHHRPEGTVGGLRAPCIVKGRLFASTFTMEPRVPNDLYCWGPAAEGEAVASSAREVPGTEGEVAFRIERVETGRKLTKRPPFSEAKGDWTLLWCRLDGGEGHFVLAEKEGRSKGLLQGVEMALWVATPQDGVRLRAAFHRAMPMKKAHAGKPGRVKAPTLIKAIDLSGPGNEQRRKWASADGELELIVAWNVKTKQGLFVEKDDRFRPAIHAVIGGLLS